MAGEVQFQGEHGKTYRVVINDPAGLVWNGTAFEAWNDANVATYGLAPTSERGTSGYFLLTFPAAITTQAAYPVFAYQTAAGSLSLTDIATPKAIGEVDWPNVTGAELPAQEVWTYVPRTLTTPTTGTDVGMNGARLTVRRGDTWSIAYDGLGNLTGNTKLWFTMKRAASDPDSASVVQIERTAGLVVI